MQLSHCFVCHIRKEDLHSLDMTSDMLDRLLLAKSSSKLVDMKPTHELEITTFFTKFGYISTV